MKREKMRFRIHIPGQPEYSVTGSPEDAIEAFEEALWEAQLLPDDECLTTADMGLPGGAPLESLLEAKGFLTYGEAYVEVVRAEA
jgi:hypothetical protein